MPNQIGIDDVSAAEGDGTLGTTPFSFTVSITTPGANPVQVDYQTSSAQAAFHDGFAVPLSRGIKVAVGQKLDDGEPGAGTSTGSA